MKTTYHIRKKRKRYRGNQFYRDYRNRSNGTFCGAPETDFDIDYHTKAKAWMDNVPCKKCMILRQKALIGIKKEMT
jgi:hypothetical protein